MRVGPHHHPCQRCHAKTECGGTWEENYDGFPEVICREYHYAGGEVNPDFVCEACSCVECGERGVRTTKYYTGPDTYIDQLMCEPCANKYENREPPDADGEDICRDYRAEERDALEAARRLK